MRRYTRLMRYYLRYYLGLFWGSLSFSRLMEMTMAINPRTKGKKAEYDARDIMRGLGWTSERVPCSGAIPTMLGDITLQKDGRSLKAEVKSRKEEFKSIYQLLSTYGTPFKVSYKGQFAVVSYSFHDLGFESREMQLYDVSMDSKTISKLFRMRQWIKGSDFLMIKDNRRPFMFIRYFGEAK